ncbi:MAG: amidohydrolase family protein, partial [Gemmatimonadetes bacterium]|nr:amidohydrolase family protein [Gemmatimonadota bacterium]
MSAGTSFTRWMVVAATATLAACAGEQSADGAGATALVGARVIDGTGAQPIENAVILVRDGRIAAVGPQDAVEIPRGATSIDVSGRTIVPGFLNAHGHVGSTDWMLLPAEEDFGTESILRDLGRYARYGVTTVLSLGEEGPEGMTVREAQNVATLDRARLFTAGPVVLSQTPDEAVAAVGERATMGVNWVKIRVDDNLGNATKMAPEIYRAVIAAAHQRGLPVAAHIFYLDDAKQLLRDGVDLIAHSVRDQPVDQELIGLLRDRDICVSPTLTREVSTFIYATRPDFFDDPFFRREVSAEVISSFEDPQSQAEVRESRAAAAYRQALEVAKANVKVLADAGVRIAMGTDTGPEGRFQGYFEHMEMG